MKLSNAISQSQKHDDTIKCSKGNDGQSTSTRLEYFDQSFSNSQLKRIQTR